MVNVHRMTGVFYNFFFLNTAYQNRFKLVHTMKVRDNFAVFDRHFVIMKGV